MVAFGLKGYFQSWRNMFDVFLAVYSTIYIIYAIVILALLSSKGITDDLKTPLEVVCVLVCYRFVCLFVCLSICLSVLFCLSEYMHTAHVFIHVLCMIFCVCDVTIVFFFLQLTHLALILALLKAFTVLVKYVSCCYCIGFNLSFHFQLHHLSDLLLPPPSHHLLLCLPPLPSLPTFSLLLSFLLFLLLQSALLNLLVTIFNTVIKSIPLIGVVFIILVSYSLVGVVWFNNVRSGEAINYEYVVISVCSLV